MMKYDTVCSIVGAEPSTIKRQISETSPPQREGCKVNVFVWTCQVVAVLAVGFLSCSVASYNWIHTSESLYVKYKSDNGDIIRLLILTKMYSGLWRACMDYDDIGKPVKQGTSECGHQNETSTEWILFED